MPNMSVSAPAMLASGEPEAAAPKATPTASPSGMLCRVMANTSRALRGSLEGGPSGTFSVGWICGRMMSINRRTPAPARKPSATGTQARRPRCAVISSAGASSDQ